MDGALKFLLVEFVLDRLDLLQGDGFAGFSISAAGRISRRSALSTMALRVVFRRAARVFASIKRSSGRSSVVFIWVMIWFYGKQALTSSLECHLGVVEQFPAAFEGRISGMTESGDNRCNVYKAVRLSSGAG